MEAISVRSLPHLPSLNSGIFASVQNLLPVPMTYPTSPPQNNPALKIHEWLAVIVLIAILGALSMMAYITKGDIGDRDRSLPAFLSKSGKIEILIEGAVAHPGIYYLPSSIAMKDVLMLAQPTPHADLRRFNLKASIKKGRMIKVPLRAMITVHLKGAIKNPGGVSILKGTRLMDLEPLIQFEENADRKSLNKKRKLKEGEIIIIQEKSRSRKVR